MHVKTLHGLSLNGAWKMQLRLYVAWIACASVAFLFTSRNLVFYPHLLLTVYLFGTAGLIVYTLIAKRQNFYVVPRVSLSFSTLLLALLTALSLVVAEDALSLWSPLPVWPEVSFTAVSTDSFYAIVGTVMISALMEEVLFRGIIMEALLHRYSDSIALLQSTLLFTLAHPDPAQMPGAFLLGLFTGYFYLRTRELSSCFIIHTVLNSVLALLMIDSGVHFAAMEPLVYYGLLGVSITALITVYYLLKSAPAPRYFPNKSLASRAS